MWDLLVGNHCQLFLGIPFPGNERLAPQTLAVSQPADTFQIFCSIYGQSNLVISYKGFLKGILFFNGPQVLKVEFIIFLCSSDLIQASPIHLFIICSFIHSHNYVCPFLPFSHS